MHFFKKIIRKILRSERVVRFCQVHVFDYASKIAEQKRIAQEKLDEQIRIGTKFQYKNMAYALMFDALHPYTEIVFPESNCPLVSIVVPVYNQYDYTLACLASIAQNTGDVDYEVILADDCSTDETKNITERVKNLRVIKNVTGPHGYLPNLNNAIPQIRGKYLCQLNNDTIVTKGWLKALVDTLEQDKTIGWCGGMVLQADGRIHELGSTLTSDGLPHPNHYREQPSQIKSTDIFDVDFSTSGLFLVSAQTLKIAGGFDSAYNPGYYEDPDFALTLRLRHGLRSVCNPKSVIYHFVNVSFANEASVIGEKNHQLFLSRWEQYLHDRERTTQSTDDGKNNANVK